jgi:hypothetical protein
MEDSQSNRQERHPMDSTHVVDERLRVAGFFVVVVGYVLSGTFATPLPALALIYVLVLTTAVDGMRSATTSTRSRRRAVVDLALLLARQMVSSWLCLFVLFISFLESTYQSNTLSSWFFGASAIAWGVLAGRAIIWTRGRTARMWSSSIRGGFALSLLTLLGGLAARQDRALMSEPYRELMGASYEVVGDDLQAYGVQSPDNQLEYITLIPGAGISGREIAFKRSIPRGSKIEIVSAWHTLMPFDNGDYYLVKVSGAVLPSSVPVKIAMFRGNEGAGVDLNPVVYRRLPLAKGVSEILCVRPVAG